MPRFFPVHVSLFPFLLGLALAGCDQSQAPAETDARAVEEPGSAAPLAALENDEESGAQVGFQIIKGEQPNDIIGRVGDQPISFNQIEIMLNSSGVIGMNIPPPGTPERNRVRLTLLDKIVSANLLYLDALDKGVDKSRVYRHEVERFTEATLGDIYRQQVLIGDISVSDEEIDAYYENNIVEGTPFTKDLGIAIEAKLRKNKFTARKVGMRDRLREGVTITIDEAQLDPAQDADRKNDAVVATVDQEAVIWGEVRILMSATKEETTVADRIKVLNDFIDRRIMLQKARAANMEVGPGYQERINEFRKVRLVSMHRGQLVEELEPTDDEIRTYYNEHRSSIMLPAARKVQMVVMLVKEDAERLKQQIESGELTFYEAAQEYSIDPNAKKTLGEMGWVEQGTGFPELDELTFSLPLNETGGPVESPAGWHLVRVLEIRESVFTNISEADTWRKTKRMIIKERMKKYTADLRKNHYTVEVYNDVLNRLLEQEMGQVADQPAAEPKEES